MNFGGPDRGPISEAIGPGATEARQGDQACKSGPIACSIGRNGVIADHTARQPRQQECAGSRARASIPSSGPELPWYELYLDSNRSPLRNTEVLLDRLEPFVRGQRNVVPWH